VLAGPQVEAAARAHNLPGEKIHGELPHLEARGRGEAAGPAQQGLEPSEELREVEGFDQVVVAARLEPAHAIVHAAPGAQEDDGRAPPPAPQLLDEAQPVAPRQHHVDDGGVEVVLQRQAQALLAVAGPLDGVAGFLKAAAHELGDHVVVLDQQDGHGPSSRALSLGPASRGEGSGAFVRAVAPLRVPRKPALGEETDCAADARRPFAVAPGTGLDLRPGQTAEPLRPDR